LTDSLIAWCRSNHMYVILDLHAAPGGQGNDLNISDRDPSKPSLWQSVANRQKTIAFWQKIATRYANEPTVGGYDILNEPNWGFEDTVRDRNGLKEQKNEQQKTTEELRTRAGQMEAEIHRRAQEIQEANRRLRQHQAELESRIETRTADLRRANDADAPLCRAHPDHVAKLVANHYLGQVSSPTATESTG